MIDIIEVRDLTGKILFKKVEKKETSRVSFRREDILDICNSNITDAIRKEFKRAACACWSFEELCIFMQFVALKCWFVKRNFINLAQKRISDLEGITSFQELFDYIRTDHMFAEDGIIDYVINTGDDYTTSVNRRRDNFVSLHNTVRTIMEKKTNYKIMKTKASISNEFIEYLSDYSKIFLELYYV